MVLFCAAIRRDSLLLFRARQVFHASINWWSFGRIWMTASLLRSQGLVSIFCRIITMVLVLPLIFNSFSLFSRLWWLFQVHQLSLVSLSPSLARCKYSLIFSLLLFIHWRCMWCNSYRRWKWTRRHEFKFWTRLIAFHIALIPLGKVWIQWFSLQL